MIRTVPYAVGAVRRHGPWPDEQMVGRQITFAATTKKKKRTSTTSDAHGMTCTL